MTHYPVFIRMDRVTNDAAIRIFACRQSAHVNTLKPLVNDWLFYDQWIP